MPFYTDYLCHLHKTIQVVATCDTNVEYQIWRFYFNWFWSYAENRSRKRISSVSTQLSKYLIVIRRLNKHESASNSMYKQSRLNV